MSRERLRRLIEKSFSRNCRASDGILRDRQVCLASSTLTGAIPVIEPADGAGHFISQLFHVEGEIR
jgi:hypothetical protein